MASPLLMESLAATRRYVGTERFGPTTWIEIGAERVQRFLDADARRDASRASRTARRAPGACCSRSCRICCRA